MWLKFLNWVENHSHHTAFWKYYNLGMFVQALVVDYAVVIAPMGGEMCTNKAFSMSEMARFVKSS
jgi:hypothetical protein